MKVTRSASIAFLLTLAAAGVVVLIAPPSEGQVRGRLIDKTPIGESFSEVLAFCAKGNLKCFQSFNAGYLNQDTGQEVGTSSIWATIEEHRYAPFLRTNASAYWGFGADGRLIDIWIWRTTDGP